MDEKMPGDRFIETLRGLRDGKTLTELEEAMNELVEAVRDTGRKGSVTLKIDLTCVTEGIYETSDNITLKAPWHALSNSLFFSKPDGNLSTDPEALITDTQTRDLCGGISTMTLWRWRREQGFPRPRKINGRNYNTRREILEHLDALLAAEAEAQT